jgi:hypothetical protein
MNTKFRKRSKLILGAASFFLLTYGLWIKFDVFGRREKNSDSQNKLEGKNKSNDNINQVAKSETNKNSAMFVSCGGFIE